MNKLECLGLSILEFSKILKYQFYYGYVKPNMVKKKLYYMDTGSFLVYICYIGYRQFHCIHRNR